MGKALELKNLELSHGLAHNTADIRTQTDNKCICITSQKTIVMKLCKGEIAP